VGGGCGFCVSLRQRGGGRQGRAQAGQGAGRGGRRQGRAQAGEGAGRGRAQAGEGTGGASGNQGHQATRGEGVPTYGGNGQHEQARLQVLVVVMGEGVQGTLVRQGEPLITACLGWAPAAGCSSAGARVGADEGASIGAGRAGARPQASTTTAQAAPRPRRACPCSSTAGRGAPRLRLPGSRTFVRGPAARVTGLELTHAGQLHRCQVIQQPQAFQLQHLAPGVGLCMGQCIAVHFMVSSCVGVLGCMQRRS